MDTRIKINQRAINVFLTDQATNNLAARNMCTIDTAATLSVVVDATITSATTATSDLTTAIAAINLSTIEILAALRERGVATTTTITTCKQTATAHVTATTTARDGVPSRVHVLSLEGSRTFASTRAAFERHGLEVVRVPGVDGRSKYPGAEHEEVCCCCAAHGELSDVRPQQQCRASRWR